MSKYQWTFGRQSWLRRWMVISKVCEGLYVFRVGSSVLKLLEKEPYILYRKLTRKTCWFLECCVLYHLRTGGGDQELVPL